MSGTAIIRAYYRLRLYNIILYIWDVFFRESNEPCKIVAWNAGCLQPSVTGNDFIGRMPASEMKRSGIELAARRSMEVQRNGCLQPSMTGNDFIGRMPASEMKRSGIELAARRSMEVQRNGCLQPSGFPHLLPVPPLNQQITGHGPQKKRRTIL